MDNIKERLETTSTECIKCFSAWHDNKKDGKARESLNEAIHELRKVASRLEIELAISERDQMVQKPIPMAVNAAYQGGPQGQDLDSDVGGGRGRQPKAKRNSTRRRSSTGSSNATSGGRRSSSAGKGSEE